MGARQERDRTDEVLGQTRVARGSSTAPALSILQGDCIEVMAAMDEASVDAIVCDPPYGLEFMGKTWDKLGGDGRQIGDAAFKQGDARHGSVRYGGAAYGQDAAAAGRAMQGWHEAWAREALRVLKPGGHLLAFGGTRTYHRLAAAVEDAGFEIRDTVAWLYGSGFPKSLDVSKAIDRAAGAERERVADSPYAGRRTAGDFGMVNDDGWQPTDQGVTAPATDEAKQWDGWGTALKPAHEPIVVARKPLVGTVAGNVLAHGTGGLNINAARVAGEERPVMVRTATITEAKSMSGESTGATRNGETTDRGRWPANVAFDEQAAEMLDTQSGILTSGTFNGQRNTDKFRSVYSAFRGTAEGEGSYEANSGGASRFFYVAKPDTDERQAGLGATAGLFSPVDAPDRNDHPTVKPITLMRWLVRLVTPPGGTVLDPFTGSGTTGCAAALEGFNFVGIEREDAYVAIARARLAHWSSGAMAA